MSHPKWNWNDIRDNEKDIKDYYTTEQYRWIKKVVREIYIWAVDQNVNIPTPYIHYPGIQYGGCRFPKINGKRRSNIKGGECVSLLFKKGNEFKCQNYVSMRVIIDVTHKDKMIVVDTNGRWDDENWYGSTLVKTGWPLRGIVNQWRANVRYVRMRGWFGWFWTLFYWLTLDEAGRFDLFYHIKSFTDLIYRK